MSSNHVVDRIRRFNLGRDPERLQLKYHAMRADVFAFFRGTCHLFHEDWPAVSSLEDAPPAWICGDLHFENFGSYKGDNQLTYFDINDFDEGALAPCSRDLVRFLVSVLAGADALALSEAEALGLCRLFLGAYAEALKAGKALRVERSVATGMVRDLLAGLKDSSRVAYYAGRIRIKKGLRLLRVDGKRTLEVTEEQRARVIRFMNEFAATQPDPKFFRVLDVGRRVAGVGSLGVERYILLVEGKGSPVGNYLLDLKHAPIPAIRPFLKASQPAWANEAERVIAVQRRAQAVAPSFLFPMAMDDRAYVLRELLPSQDRIRLELWDGKLRRLEGVMGTMGQVVAWSHLRSGGRQGSAVADAWIEFGHRTDWPPILIDYAITYGKQVRRDWEAFGAAFDSGLLAPSSS
ncbi:MAG: DUF2252 family protein [Sulfuricella sp.]|nr:DUF2252 family protein [Sulfuricella sp.]